MDINNIQGVYKYTERCKHINARGSIHAAYHDGFANYTKMNILWRLKSKLYKNENPLEAGRKQTLFFSKILWGGLKCKLCFFSKILCKLG